jgi:endonuclease/exonuclease/phosphatase family metal-dependent hydrolase
MLHGFPNFANLEQRTALLNGEIGRLAVDIVLLQEVPWTNEHGQIVEQLAEQNGFNYVYLRANGNRRLIGFEEGAAILSRYPLKNLSFAELQPVAGFFENRIVLHANVETPQGNIDLFVTHLTHGKESINAAQTEALLTFVQNTANFPAIVSGDFNAVEDSPQILKLAEVWQDSYRLTYPNDPGETCCVTDLTNSPPNDLQERLDYFFLVQRAGEMITTLKIERVFAEPFAVANGRLWLSDHAGLLATVTIEPNQ